MKRIKPFSYDDWILIVAGNYGSNLSEKELKKEYKEYVKHANKCECEFKKRLQKY